MPQTDDTMTEEKIDQMVRVLHRVRFLFILLLALAAPSLYFLEIIKGDMVIWMSIAFAFMAVSDWFIIDRLIKRIEKAREQIR